MSDVTEVRSQAHSTIQMQSNVEEANIKPATPKERSPGESSAKADTDSKSPEHSKTADSAAAEMSSRPPPVRPQSSGAPMYRDQQHYNQSQQLFPVHTIPIVVHQSQQAKQRSNYSKVAMNRGRGAPPPAAYFVQHRRAAPEAMPAMDEGPTVKQHLQEQQKQAKEKMYQEARQYVPMDDGPMTSSSQPTIRTESGQILKTFTVQTISSTAQIHMPGSRQMAPPQQQTKRPTPPHRLIAQAEARSASRGRITTPALQTNNRKVKVIVQPGVTTPFTTAHQKQQLATQPYVVSTQPLSSNSGVPGNVPQQIYSPASSQQQPIPIQPRPTPAGVGRAEASKNKPAVRRKPSESKNPSEFKALTTVVPVTTPSLVSRPPQLHPQQKTNSPPMVAAAESEETEGRRQVDPTGWELRVKQIKEREQAILDQRVRENQEKERRMFDERHREECRKIDEKIHEEQQRRRERAAEEDRKRQEIELRERQELEAKMREEELRAEDEAIAEMEILQQMEMEEQAALLSRQNSTQLVHNTGMEVSLDDLLATSTNESSWSFEAMDPSQEQLFIDDSFLNIDEGVFLQEHLDCNQMDEYSQYANMGYGQEFHYQQPQQYPREQQMFQEPAPMIENLFPISEDIKEDPLSKLLSNPSIMEEFPDMFTDKSIFDSFPDLGDDLGNILDTSPIKKDKPKRGTESPDLAISLVDWVMNDDHEDDDGEALLKLRDERLESTASEYMNVCAEVDFSFDIGPSPIEDRPLTMQPVITPEPVMLPQEQSVSQKMIPIPSHSPAKDHVPLAYHLPQKPMKAPTPPRVMTPPEAKTQKKTWSPNEQERVAQPVVAAARPRDRRRLDDRNSRQKKAEMDAIEKEKEARQIAADRERVRQIMLMEEKAIEAEKAAEALIKPNQAKKKSRVTPRNRSQRSLTGSPAKATTPIATPKAVTPPAPAVLEQPRTTATSPLPGPSHASLAKTAAAQHSEMPRNYDPMTHQQSLTTTTPVLAASHPVTSATLSSGPAISGFFDSTVPMMEPGAELYPEEGYDADLMNPLLLDPALLDPALLDPALLDPSLDPVLLEPHFIDHNLMMEAAMMDPEDYPMDNELDQYLSDSQCSDVDKEWYTDLDSFFSPESFLPMDPVLRPDRPFSEENQKGHYDGNEAILEEPKQKGRRSNSFTTGMEPEKIDSDASMYFVDDYGNFHVLPTPDQNELDEAIIDLISNEKYTDTYSHLLEKAILEGDDLQLDALLNEIENLELCEMYSNVPTDALFQLLDSPGELMSGEEIVRLRDEHGVDINKELEVDDVNCGIEIPHSVLENPDPEIMAEYEWKKNLFQAFLLFPENERVEEINFMEKQVYEVEAAMEELFACKLKVIRDGLTSILYSNAAMVDEVSRISGKLLVTSEERKLLARRLCHHQRNYIRRLQTASKRRSDAERRRKEMEAAGIFPTPSKASGKKKGGSSTPKKAPVPGAVPKKRGRPFSKNLPRPPDFVGPTPSPKKIERSASTSSTKSNSSKKSGRGESAKKRKKLIALPPGGLMVPPPSVSTTNALKAILHASQEKKRAKKLAEAEAKNKEIKKEEPLNLTTQPTVEETKEVKPKKTKGMKGYVYEDVTKIISEQKPPEEPKPDVNPDAPIGLRKAPRRSTQILNFVDFSPRGTPDPEEEVIVETAPKRKKGRPRRDSNTAYAPKHGTRQKKPPSRAPSRAKSEVDVSEPSSPRSVAESLESTKSDQDANVSPPTSKDGEKKTIVSPETPTSETTEEKEGRKMRPRRATQSRVEEPSPEDEPSRKRRRLRTETPTRQSARRKS